MKSVLRNHPSFKDDISRHPERSVEYDLIAKLAPLLVLDIVSLSLLFGGEYGRKHGDLHTSCFFRCGL